MNIHAILIFQWKTSRFDLKTSLRLQCNLIEQEIYFRNYYKKNSSVSKIKVNDSCDGRCSRAYPNGLYMYEFSVCVYFSLILFHLFYGHSAALQHIFFFLLFQLLWNTIFIFHLDICKLINSRTTRLHYKLFL